MILVTGSTGNVGQHVVRALRKLGSDMRDARRRRRIPTQVMAERAGVSRTTLLKVEWKLRSAPGAMSWISSAIAAPSSLTTSQ